MTWYRVTLLALGLLMAAPSLMFLAQFRAPRPVWLLAWTLRGLPILAASQGTRLVVLTWIALAQDRPVLAQHPAEIALSVGLTALSVLVAWLYYAMYLRYRRQLPQAVIDLLVKQPNWTTGQGKNG